MDVKDFRPISFFFFFFWGGGGMYNIIYIVIKKRFKSVLGNIISNTERIY
jgi:hypothetical protein